MKNCTLESNTWLMSVRLNTVYATARFSPSTVHCTVMVNLASSALAAVAEVLALAVLLLPLVLAMLLLLPVPVLGRRAAGAPGGRRLLLGASVGALLAADPARLKRRRVEDRALLAASWLGDHRRRGRAQSWLAARRSLPRTHAGAGVISATAGVAECWKSPRGG